MDSHNLFETPATYRALRLEYLVAALVAFVLLVIHIEDVRLIPALVLFAYNDIIGYIPGAIAYRRSGDGRISRVYYVLYNVMHSAVTAAIIAGVWALVAGFEWAMLIMVVHLAGDRSVFGNFMKPFSVHFEPREHPTYAKVKDLLARWPDEAEPALAPVPAAKADGSARRVGSPQAG